MKKLILISIFALCTLIGYGQLDVNGSSTQYVYEYNQYGVKEKVGYWEKDFSGRWMLYYNDKYGIPRKYGYYEKNFGGGWTWDEFDKYGILHKKSTTEQ